MSLAVALCLQVPPDCRQFGLYDELLATMDDLPPLFVRFVKGREWWGLVLQVRTRFL